MDSAHSISKKIKDEIGRVTNINYKEPNQIIIKLGYGGVPTEQFKSVISDKIEELISQFDGWKLSEIEKNDTDDTTGVTEYEARVISLNNPPG